MVAAIIGASLSEPHTIVVYGNTCIDRPTDRVCPSHVILICCTCSRCHAHVCSEQGTVTRRGREHRWWEGEKGDTRTMKCEAGKREIPVKTEESNGRQRPNGRLDFSVPGSNAGVGKLKWHGSNERQDYSYVGNKTVTGSGNTGATTGMTPDT